MDKELNFKKPIEVIKVKNPLTLEQDGYCNPVIGLKSITSEGNIQVSISEQGIHFKSLSNELETFIAGDNITIVDSPIESGKKIISAQGGLNMSIEDLANSLRPHFIDNDTLYGDTNLVNRITQLENKVDNDTIYDDSELRRLITNLDNKQKQNKYITSFEYTERPEKLEAVFNDNTRLLITLPTEVSISSNTLVINKVGKEYTIELPDRLKEKPTINLEFGHWTTIE